MMEEIIEIRSLKKIYEKNLVLKNTSFSVKKGTIHGFIGPNGAGKTTTIKSLTNSIKPNQGEIWLMGKKIGKDYYVNQRIGFMTELLIESIK